MKYVEKHNVDQRDDLRAALVHEGRDDFLGWAGGAHDVHRRFGTWQIVNKVQTNINIIIYASRFVVE